MSDGPFTHELEWLTTEPTNSPKKAVHTMMLGMSRAVAGWQAQPDGRVAVMLTAKVDHRALIEVYVGNWSNPPERRTEAHGFLTTHYRFRGEMVMWLRHSQVIATFKGGGGIL